MTNPIYFYVKINGMMSMKNSGTKNLPLIRSKNKKRKLLFLLFLFLTGLACAEKIATFSDIVNPDNFIISGDRLYLSEDAVISIYSMKDFTLLKKFGKEGEGPQEFFINRARGWDMIQLFINNGQLVVNSSGTRFSYFTRDGVFLREVRMPLGYGVIEPFGDNYLATRFKTVENGDTHHMVVLYDSQYKKIKEIYEHKHGLQIRKRLPFNPLTTEQAFFETCADKIFVISGDRSVIHIFDGNGKKLSAITIKDELVKFTAEDKKREIESYRHNKFWNRYYQTRKHLFKFPEYFPPISWFWIDPVKKVLYVETRKIEKGEKKWLLFDFKGQLLRKVRLPYIGMKIFLDGKYYRLIENEAAEAWELHVIETGF